MGNYCVTLLNDAGTGDNVWVELIAASGVTIGVYKINVGLAATAADNATGRIRVFRETTAASGLVAGTIIDLDPTSAAPTSTCNVKAVGVFGGSGTVTDTLMDCAISFRQTFEWVARDKDDYLYSVAGGRMIFRLVNLNSTGNHVYNVYFKEF